MKRFIQILGQALLIVGLGVLGYPVMSWVYAEGFQAYQQWAFDHDTTNWPDTLAPAAPQPHSVIGRLEIAKLDLSVMILEGTDERDLLLGAGHVAETALPGELGNVAIVGHRDTFFRALRDIHEGDIILLTSRRGSHPYVVESTEIVGPTETEVLQPSPTPILTLITCYPFSYVGSAPERFVVRARRVDTPATPAST